MVLIYTTLNWEMVQVGYPRKKVRNLHYDLIRIYLLIPDENGVTYQIHQKEFVTLAKSQMIKKVLV